MVNEQTIKKLEKQLRRAWDEKLRKEGFKPGGSAGNHPDDPKFQHLNELMIKVMGEKKPIEMRVIHEAVFNPNYINAPTYRIYYR